MKRLQDILSEVTERYRWHPAETLMEITLRWPTVVPPDVAAVMVPVAFLDGSLTVAVPSSVWVQEFSYWRQDLMAQINAALEVPRVQRIRFVVRAMPRPTRAVDVTRLGSLLSPPHDPNHS